jgi:hypothetical protein
MEFWFMVVFALPPVMVELRKRVYPAGNGEGDYVGKTLTKLMFYQHNVM